MTIEKDDAVSNESGKTLLPCPFCGKQPRYGKVSIGTDNPMVICGSSYQETGRAHCPASYACVTVAQWNQRKDSALTQQLAQLQAQNAELKADRMVIQAVYTRSGRAVVCGIPDERHNCDEMACSSVEHILWRGPHVVDEKPARDAMTDWRNGENMAVQNKRDELVDVVSGEPIDPMKRTYGGVTREQFDMAALREQNTALLAREKQMVEARSGINDERLTQLKLWLERKFNRHGEQEDFEAGNALVELIAIRALLRPSGAALSPSGKAGEGASRTSEGGGSV